MNLARRFDSPQSKDIQRVLITLSVESMQQNLRSYPNISKLSMLMSSPCGRDLFGECRERGHHKPNPLGSHAVHQAVTKKPQRPPAAVRLRVHRDLGLEKLLDHLRVALLRRIVQRGQASVRSPGGAPDAPSHKMIEIDRNCASGDLSLKAWYQVVGVHVRVSGPFSYSLHV